MILGNLLNSIRIELQDQGSTIYTDDELIRGIEKTISLMTRHLPKRAVLDITITAPMFSATNYNMLYIQSVLDSTDYIRIERIEFPVDTNPVTLPTFDMIGDYIVFRQKQTFTVGDKVRVIYLKPWTYPTTSSEADYPTHLDNPVIIGAAGQGLIFKAELYTQKALTAADLIISTLAGLSAITATPPTLVVPTSPTLDALVAPTAYTLVAPVAPSIGAVPTAPTAPTLSFTAAETALTAIETDVALGLGYLVSGLTYINAATRGSEVSSNYGKYADSAINAAVVKAQEALARLKQIDASISKYQGEVNAYQSQVNGYAASLNNTLALYQQNIASQVAASGAKDSATAIYKAGIDNNVTKISKYASEIQSYQAQVNKWQIDVQYYAAQINKLTSYAQLLAPTVTNYLDIAGRYLASGQAKINEFAAMLGIKLEFYTQRAASEQR